MRPLGHPDRGTRGPACRAVGARGRADDRPRLLELRAGQCVRGGLDHALLVRGRGGRDDADGGRHAMDPRDRPGVTDVGAAVGKGLAAVGRSRHPGPYGPRACCGLRSCTALARYSRACTATCFTCSGSSSHRSSSEALPAIRSTSVPRSRSAVSFDTRGFASVWRAVADESGVSDRREVVTRSAPVGRFEPSWGQSLSVSRRDARPGHEGVVSAWPLVDENRVPCGLRSCGAGYAVRSAARRLSCRAGHRWPAPIETGRTGEPE